MATTWLPFPFYITVFHALMKHNDISPRLLRGSIRNCVFVLKQESTENMVADVSANVRYGNLLNEHMSSEMCVQSSFKIILAFITYT